MEMRLKGKRVLVTGGTRGIGLAIVEAMLKEGASVVLCARDEQRVAEVVDGFSKRGFSVSGSSVDIADAKALDQWVNEAATKMHGIDIAIANPSAFGIGTTEQDWHRGYDVDLMGSVRLLAAAEPYLTQAASDGGDAAMLVLSSVLASEADAESAYGSYKAALDYHAKAAARRLAAQHVRVNTISPGTIYVEDGFWGNAKRQMPEIYELFFNRNPMGRMGTPDEIANAALFLCSPVASFITGANLHIDGAFSSRVNY